eukprot:gene3924-4900_t
MVLIDDSSGNPQSSDMTMPKVLDFLQSEWFKYEIDRSHWVAEKSELLSKISQLESEKRVNEIIKNDLSKRIKMLEYALQQERKKNNNSIASTSEDDINTVQNHNDSLPKRDLPKKSKENITRNLIRKYLKDMGYNDIIVSRAQPIDDPNAGEEDEDTNNFEDPKAITILNTPSQQQQQPISTTTTTTNTNVVNSISSKSKKKNLKQLQSLQEQLMFDVINDDNNSSGNNNNSTTTTTTNNNNSLSFDLGLNSDNLVQSLDSLSSSTSDLGASFDSESLLDSLKQLDNFSTSGIDSSNSNSLESSQELNLDDKLNSSNSNNNNLNNSVIQLKSSLPELPTVSPTSQSEQQPPVEESFDSMNEDFFNKLSSNSKVKQQQPTRKSLTSDLLGLRASDLNDITFEDNNKYQSETSAPRYWKYRNSLKSHLDGVRSIQFHPTDPILISASEDHTIKIWNLNHLIPSKKSVNPDVEPIYTMRGHLGPVFTTEISEDGNSFFSAGYDMIIKQWSIPSPDIDPYYCHGKVVNYLEREFVGHTDGIWDLLALPQHNNRLLSASSDGTVVLWDISSTTKLRTFINGGGTAPTSISVPPTEGSRQMLVSYNDGSILLYDIETGENIRKLKPASESGYNEQINKIVSHPLLPLAITGSEDHKIEFWDLKMSTPVHSMIAHANSVSSLTIDPSGLYVASCSHDSAIRFWDISSKTCIQDLNSHRPKYDESIHSIKYHPTKGYFASSGADAVVRIHQ